MKQEEKQSDLEKILKIFCSLHQKGQEMDEKLKEIRVEIHNMIWTLINLKKSQMGKNNAQNS